MKKFYFSVLILFALPLYAKVLISPIDVMKSNYPSATEIKKKNILLSKKEFKEIQSESQVRLRSKIFKIFIAKKSDEVLAYGILMHRKVRSKSAVVLYIISKESELKSIEIIAFNEPLEYLPSQKWKDQFKDISSEENLYLGEDIATITGATLSARSIIDSSRVAFAFYNSVLKGK